MLPPTPIEPSADAIEWLRSIGRRNRGAKVSLFVAPDATEQEIRYVVSECWAQRPLDASPTLLQAVLRHLCGSAIDLMADHRARTSGIACFAMLDGSIHDDTWIQLEHPVPTQAFVGVRFRLHPIVEPALLHVSDVVGEAVAMHRSLRVQQRS